MNHNGQLKDYEREKIFLYSEQGYGFREIGRRIGRDHTVISREMERNRGPNGGYQPFLAQEQAVERKSAANKLNPLKNSFVYRYVINKLNEDWSPEEIAGRLKIDLPGQSICPETIYSFIYNKENRHLKLWINLRRAKPRRSGPHGRKPQKENIPNRIFIDERPEEINQKRKLGHWETDNMLGKRELCAASATTERKSGYLILTKLNSLKSEEKKEALIVALGRFPHWMRKSITFDNGSENVKHEEVAKALNLLTYFCHPYHFWEKGLVENTIGLVRQYLPKGKSLREVTQADLNWVADRINNRPRKRLGYKTPYEVFYEQMV